MLLMCLEVLREGFFSFPVRDWEGVCRKPLSLVFLIFQLLAKCWISYLSKSHGNWVTVVIRFCTRKLIKGTHFMSPLKIINLFQDMMPNFSPKNVGLEVSRPAIFMINRTQLKPKNQVLYVRKTWCEPLHFCWRVVSPTKFNKKIGEGKLDINTTFRWRLLGKMGVRFFRMVLGGAVFT